jgi:hypothetical protein
MLRDAMCAEALRAPARRACAVVGLVLFIRQAVFVCRMTLPAL